MSEHSYDQRIGSFSAEQEQQLIHLRREWADLLNVPPR
jgi:hypothetical protein